MSFGRVAIALALAVTVPVAVNAAPLRERDAAAIQAIEQNVVVPGKDGGKATSVSLAERMRELGVPAVSIAYFEQGKIRWVKSFGLTAASGGKAVSPDTQFQAASMSKAVAAALAMRLVDRGQLTLDGDVNQRLKAWRIPDDTVSTAPVTLRQLLSHTGGLTVSGYPGYQSGTPTPTIVQSLRGTSPSNTPAVVRKSPPGTAASYSGGGYSVAQLLVNETSGTDFAKFAAQQLFGPLKLKRTSFVPPAKREGPALAHDGGGETLAGGSHLYPELAAAGLWTTPSDYARFLIALQNAVAGKQPAILRQETAVAMTTAVMDGQGLGVRVGSRGGRLAISHGGSNAGYRCQFVAHLDGVGEGAVVMTNGENGGALIGHVMQMLEQHYWGRALPSAGGTGANGSTIRSS